MPRLPLALRRPHRRTFPPKGGVGRERASVTVAATLCAVALGAAACSAPGPPLPGTEHSAGSANANVPPPPTRASSQHRSPGAAPRTAASGSAKNTAAAHATCAQRIVAKLSPEQRAGQLIMVGLDANAGRTSLDALMARRHLGGVILLGGWYDGADDVRKATRHLARLDTPASKAGLGLLLAADQEGGAVQQLRGSGFTRFPAALEQGKVSPAQLTATAATMARELRAAGINVNLAPVADTVPAELGRQNAPIGRWGRQLSPDPDRVARMVPALVTGLEAGNVASTVKHFPGIGRITGNTDLTATGITDPKTSATDPYVKPFASGINAGADIVMVSSAVYPRIDPKTNAVFSRKIVTDLLRGQLGFDGVVITDDVGAAKAVAAVPPGQRAVRSVAAGGDITLTAAPSGVTAMHGALTAQMAKDKVFAAKVEAAAQRVVALKASLGLAHCP